VFIKHNTIFEISKVNELKKYFIMKFGCFVIKKNILKYENEDILVVATCGKWRQGNAGLDLREDNF